MVIPLQKQSAKSLVTRPRTTSFNLSNPLTPLRLDLNNNLRRPRVLTTKRCLFGAPDPQQVEQLAREEYRQERGRFLTQYGVDIGLGRNVGNGSCERNAVDDDVKEVVEAEERIQDENSCVVTTAAAAAARESGAGKSNKTMSTSSSTASSKKRMQAALKPYNKVVKQNRSDSSILQSIAFNRS